MKWLTNMVLNTVGLDNMVAIAVNWLLANMLAKKNVSEYYSKTKAILEKSKQSLDLALDILKDDTVTEDEVTKAKLEVARIWAASAEAAVAARMPEADPYYDFPDETSGNDPIPM